MQHFPGILLSPMSETNIVLTFTCVWIAGREGLQGKDAEKAISQVKIAAGGELAEEVHPVVAQCTCSSYCQETP